MQKFSTPDSSWSCFENTQTHEVFIQHYVLKGRFHSLVPKDIVEDYEIVEYILAYSYFHFPMFDEAMRKLLSMYEMALKLKYREVTDHDWRDFKGKDEKGRRISPNLNNLIDWLCNGKHLPYDKEVYHSFRKIRNYFMHPEKSNQGMILFRQKLLDLHNCFNEIFLPFEVLQNRKEKLEYYQLEVSKLNQETVNVYHNEKNVHYKSVQVLYNLEDRLILRFVPFYSEIIFSDNSMECPKDLIITIKDFSFEGNNLIGNDPKNDNPILITPSKKTISQVEIDKTVEFHNCHYSAPYYATLQSRINEYLSWELYEVNSKIGEKL